MQSLHRIPDIKEESLQHIYREVRQGNHCQNCGGDHLEGVFSPLSDYICPYCRSSFFVAVSFDHSGQFNGRDYYHFMEQVYQKEDVNLICVEYNIFCRRIESSRILSRQEILKLGVGKTARDDFLPGFSLKIPS